MDSDTDSDSSSSLLIFKQRGYERKEQPQSQYDQITQTMPVPQEKVKMKKVSDLFCTNHPWRHAYALCASDNLPYCYVDLIEHNGKLYCMQDIDSAAKVHQMKQETKYPNAFSTLASVLLLTNSILLGYFTYPQAPFNGIQQVLRVCPCNGWGRFKEHEARDSLVCKADNREHANASWNIAYRENVAFSRARALAILFQVLQTSHLRSGSLQPSCCILQIQE